MAKVFIGGSRKWDMFPDDVIVDLDDRIIRDIVNDACVIRCDKDIRANFFVVDNRIDVFVKADFLHFF